MTQRLIIDGNAVYELDEVSMLQKEIEEKQDRQTKQVKQPNKKQTEKTYNCR
ncbi:MAG: hypothetical protein RR275_07845 [Lachnospiraceae bacterium]